MVFGCVGVVNGRDGGSNGRGYDLMKMNVGVGEKVKPGDGFDKLISKDGW